VLYIASHIVAVILGMLSRHYHQAFRICMILALPMMWLISHYAPRYFSMPRANQDGFLNFYYKIYEKLSPDAMVAVILFPAFFIAGRWIYVIYRVYFYKEKIESNVKKKQRVYAMYDMED